MSTTYEYTKTSLPYLEAIETGVDASAMTDKSYEDSSWDGGNDKLYVVFTNALSGGDKTILDGIISGLPAKPTGKSSWNQASEAISDTTSGDWETKVSMETADIPNGGWRFEWYFELTSSPGTMCKARVILDGTVIGCEAETDGVIENVGGFGYVNLDDGDHDLKIQWKRDSGSGNAWIRRARLEIKKVS